MYMVTELKDFVIYIRGMKTSEVMKWTFLKFPLMYLSNRHRHPNHILP